MWCAWLHGGHDPFQLFHGLDASFRPIDPREGTEPIYPAWPWRYKAFLYACGLVAAWQHRQEVQAMATGGVTRTLTG